VSSKTRRRKGEKSPHLNRVTHFLSVVYEGASSPNVSLRTASNSVGTLHCRGKKNIDDGSRLDFVEIFTERKI